MQSKLLFKAEITLKLDQILQASFSQDLKIPKDCRVYSFPGNLFCTEGCALFDEKYMNCHDQFYIKIHNLYLHLKFLKLLL